MFLLRNVAESLQENREVAGEFHDNSPADEVTGAGHGDEFFYVARPGVFPFVEACASCTSENS